MKDTDKNSKIFHWIIPEFFLHWNSNKAIVFRNLTLYFSSNKNIFATYFLTILAIPLIETKESGKK